MVTPQQRVNGTPQQHQPVTPQQQQPAATPQQIPAAGQLASPRTPQQQLEQQINHLTGKPTKSEQLSQVVFEMGAVVSRGARCIIKAGLNKHNGTRVAIKITGKKVEGFNNIAPREVEVMKMLDHPQCLYHHKVYYDKDRTFHIMELMQGGTIMDRVLETRGIAEEDAACTIQSLLQVLQYLHENGMAHLNLDPTHIFFQSADPLSPHFYSVKLGGFGLLKGPEDLPDRSGKRDPFYAAPEIIDSTSDGEGGPAADRWSVGAILYIMLCSFPPFVYNSQQELADKVKRASFVFPSPFWDVISDLAKDFIKRLLTAAPAKRSSLDACFKHPWMMAVREVLTSKSPNLYRAELLLRRLHIFKDLDAKSQTAIAEKLRLVQVPSGQMIVRNHVTADCMFFVNSGSAQTLVNGEEIECVSTGGFFGESALLLTGQHIADVRAVGTGWRNSRHALRSHDATELFVLPRPDFDAIMLQFPLLKARFLAVGAAFLLRVQRARMMLCPQPDLEVAAEHESLINMALPPPNATQDGLHRRISFQLDGPPEKKAGPVAAKIGGKPDPTLQAKLKAAEAKLAQYEKGGAQESKTCVVS